MKKKQSAARTPKKNYGKIKKFGVLDYLPGGIWRVFVGYCPKCNEKIYISVEQTRSLVIQFNILEKKEKSNNWILKIFKKIKIPKLKIIWEKEYKDSENWEIKE